MYESLSYVFLARVILADLGGLIQEPSLSHADELVFSLGFADDSQCIG